MPEHTNESLTQGCAAPATPAPEVAELFAGVAAPAHLLAVSFPGLSACVAEFVVVAGVSPERAFEAATGELHAELVRLGFPCDVLAPGGPVTVDTLARGLAVGGPALQGGVPVGVRRTVRLEEPLRAFEVVCRDGVVLGPPPGQADITPDASVAEAAQAAALAVGDAGGRDLVLQFRLGWVAGSSAAPRWWLVKAWYEARNLSVPRETPKDSAATAVEGDGAVRVDTETGQDGGATEVVRS